METIGFIRTIYGLYKGYIRIALFFRLKHLLPAYVNSHLDLSGSATRNHFIMTS